MDAFIYIELFLIFPYESYESEKFESEKRGVTVRLHFEKREKERAGFW